jgi:hypothetical protein
MKRITALAFVLAALVSAAFVPAAGATPGGGNGPRGNPQSGGSNGLGPICNPSPQSPQGRGWMLGVPCDI